MVMELSAADGMIVSSWWHDCHSMALYIAPTLLSLKCTYEMKKPSALNYSVFAEYWLAIKIFNWWEPSWRESPNTWFQPKEMEERKREKERKTLKGSDLWLSLTRGLRINLVMESRKENKGWYLVVNHQQKTSCFVILSTFTSIIRCDVVALNCVSLLRDLQYCQGKYIHFNHLSSVNSSAKHNQTLPGRPITHWKPSYTTG